MPIKMVRIDDRLIHGQVVEGWIPHLKVNMVVIVSDQAASDSMQRSLMRLALPDALGLEVCSVSEAAGVLKGGEKNETLRILVLAPGPREVLGLLEEGVEFKSVNVGGMHYSVGNIQLGRALFMSESDKEALLKVAAKGIAIEGRGLPGDESADICRLLGQC